MTALHEPAAAALNLRDAAVDDFKTALASLASGVTVITVREDGRPMGMTASSFASVSIDPLLVLVCVNRSARTHGQILQAGRFGVNILGATGRDVSEYCSRPGQDKSIPPEWLEPCGGDDAPPVVRGAMAHLDCEVYDEMAAGTHSVLLGSVRRIGVFAQEPVERHHPLVYYRGRYHGLVQTA